MSRRHIRASWMRGVARGPAGAGSALFILLLGVIALIGPTFLPSDPLALSANPMVPPGGVHLLGTDDLGRDVIAQLVLGVRVSLSVGLIAALAATFIGLLVGAIAGYAGGWVDTMIMRIAEVFQVMPSFILDVVIVALAGPGLTRG